MLEYLPGMARKYITVSFPPKDDALYRRINDTCPRAVGLAEHMRDLAREALDATAEGKRIFLARHSDQMARPPKLWPTGKVS